VFSPRDGVKADRPRRHGSATARIQRTDGPAIMLAEAGPKRAGRSSPNNTTAMGYLQEKRYKKAIFASKRQSNTIKRSHLLIFYVDETRFLYLINHIDITILSGLRQLKFYKAPT
jgi:hypothetical protein